jgi:hypothetical protein
MNEAHMNTKTLDLTADLIDVRDIIERVEKLELEVDSNGEGEHISEWKALTAILYHIKGKGGDEQWRGDWYPVTLIRDSHFTSYAREMLEDCGTIPRDLPTWIEIDWKATARNVKMDYTSVEIDGVTYWTR